jgi:hypothetical protein
MRLLAHYAFLFLFTTEATSSGAKNDPTLKSHFFVDTKTNSLSSILVRKPFPWKREVADVKNT